MASTLPAQPRAFQHHLDELVSEGTSLLLGARQIWKAPKDAYTRHARKNVARPGAAAIRQIISIMLADLRDGIDPHRVEQFAHFLIRLTRPFKRLRVLPLREMSLAENSAERAANEFQDRIHSRQVSRPELIEARYRWVAQRDAIQLCIDAIDAELSHSTGKAA